MPRQSACTHQAACAPNGASTVACTSPPVAGAIVERPTAMPFGVSRDSASMRTLFSVPISASSD